MWPAAVEISHKGSLSQAKRPLVTEATAKLFGFDPENTSKASKLHALLVRKSEKSIRTCIIPLRMLCICRTYHWVAEPRLRLVTHESKMHLPSLSCIKMFADNCLKKSFCYEVPRFQPSCREMDCFLEFLTGVIVKASSVLVCTKYILANCRTCLLIFLPSFYSLLATRQIPCYLTRWWEIHSHDKLLLVCI